jgi:hypothetical protein
VPLIIGLSKNNIHFGVNMLELWKPLFFLEHENMWVLKSCYGNYVAMKDAATSKFHVYVYFCQIQRSKKIYWLFTSIHTQNLQLQDVKPIVQIIHSRCQKH